MSFTESDGGRTKEEGERICEEEEKGLKVHRVTLFKHGIACIYRSGWVSNVPSERENQVFYLPPNSMNDCLKSLSITDAKTGHALSSISFQSSPPAVVNKTLASALDSTLLDHLRGSRVRVTVISEGEGDVASSTKTFEGVLLGLDNLPFSKPFSSTSSSSSSSSSLFGSGQIFRGVCLLTEDGRFINIPTVQIQELRFLEGELAHEIKNLCSITTHQRTLDSLPIQLFDTRPGPQVHRSKVNLQYTIESPVWKITYRIFLPQHRPFKNPHLDSKLKEKENKESEQEEVTTLECWAIIDNRTAEDWKDVQLSLVSGLPLSFTQDLYSVETYQRPTLVKEPKGDLRVWAKNAVGAAGPPPQQQPQQTKQALQKGKGYHKDWTQHTASQAEVLRIDNKSQRATFEYEVGGKVNVPRGQSALVPVFKTPFVGRRILIFNQKVQDRHPLVAVFMRNNTQKLLAAGAATIYEDNKYSGESLLEQVKQDHEAIIPFTVESRCIVTRRVKTENLGVQRTKVEDVKLQLFETCLVTTTYKIQNKSPEHFEEFFLEHHAQLSSGFKKEPDVFTNQTQSKPKLDVYDYPWVLETQQNLMKRSPNTSDVPYNRFNVNLEPFSELTFQVIESQQRKSTVDLAKADRTLVEYWTQKEYIDTSVSMELKSCIALVEEFKSRRRYMLNLEQEMNNLYQRQVQIRQDLQARGVVLGQADDTAALSNIDEMISRIEAEVAALTQQETTREELWKTKLKSLSYERIFEAKQKKEEPSTSEDSLTFAANFPTEMAQFEEERRKNRAQQQQQQQQPKGGFSFGSTASPNPPSSSSFSVPYPIQPAPPVQPAPPPVQSAPPQQLFGTGASFGSSNPASSSSSSSSSSFGFGAANSSAPSASFGSPSPFGSAIYNASPVPSSSGFGGSSQGFSTPSFGFGASGLPITGTTTSGSLFGAPVPTASITANRTPGPFSTPPAPNPIAPSVPKTPFILPTPSSNNNNNTTNTNNNNK